jgi:Na+/H+ antiporter NhaD/arsenite permease-like protein
MTTLQNLLSLASELVESASVAIDAKTTYKVKTKGWAERTWRERIFLIWLGFVTLLVIVLLAIPPPPAVRAEFNLGLVPLGAAILTMVVDTLLSKTYAHDVLQNIDWTVILLFIGLFVWLEGFQNTCYITKALDELAPLMNLHTIEGVVTSFHGHCDHWLEYILQRTSHYLNRRSYQ